MLIALNLIDLFVAAIAGAALLIYTYWEDIKAFFTSGIGNIVRTLLNWSPLGLFCRAFATVFSWFGVELPEKFSTFGGQIIEGLWQGLKARWESMKGWITGIAVGMADAFSSALGISSPSRVFMDIGGFAM
ncbi:MAG: hypothetical protein LBF61_09435 [Azoarcus sp.]|jgi:hypothetical protein|nr:hypothetical protein [Azoarcus sp.]